MFIVKCNEKHIYSWLCNYKPLLIIDNRATLRYVSSVRAIINKCTLKAVFRQQFSSRWQRGRWWWQERATCTVGSLWAPRSLWWGPWRSYPMPNWQTLLLTQHTPEWPQSSTTCSCMLKITYSLHVAFQRLVYFTYTCYLLLTYTCHVVETVHLYKYWPLVRLLQTVGECESRQSNHQYRENADVAFSLLV